MGKITVKHFVNKGLNYISGSKKESYPVYVQVITLSKNLKFKSNNGFFEYLSEDNLNDEQVQSILGKEAEIIEGVVSSLIENGKEELVTSRMIGFYSKTLSNVIDENFSKLLNEERKDTDVFVPNIILKSTYSEIHELIYFWNDESPLSNISNTVRYCLNAISTIYDEVSKKKYLVYDLYEGKNKETIITLLNSENGFDEERTKKALLILRNLVEM